jgi:hypothetical protein
MEHFFKAVAEEVSLLKTALPQAHSVHFAQDHIAARKLRLFN